MTYGTSHRLYRSRDERWIAGVAGGIAAYLNVHPLLIRIIWVLAALSMGPISMVVAIVLYLALALQLPLEPEGL